MYDNFLPVCGDLMIDALTFLIIEIDVPLYSFK